MYRVIYEVNDSLPGIQTFPFPMLILVVVSIVLMKFPEILAKNRSRESAIKLARVWLTGSLSLVFLTLVISIYTEKHVVDAYLEGKYKVVEGRVEQFNPMSYSGHGKESFIVDHVRFEYSQNIVKPGFRKTRTRGGPIRDGLNVRISYMGGMILKLEIKEE